MTGPALVVIAKAPRPGRSKTRLTPPLSAAGAAGVAEAALRDTLEAVLATPAARHVVALDGPRGAWLDERFEVVGQRGAGLAERLASAFEDVGGPALVLGMDTPQVTSELLAASLDALQAPDVDAVLGPALDGGYWTIGLRRADRRVFAGVPMSADETCDEQRRRLVELGLRHVELPPLRDVDTISDARAVRRQVPRSRFAAALAAAGA